MGIEEQMTGKKVPPPCSFFGVSPALRFWQFFRQESSQLSPSCCRVAQLLADC